MTPHVIAYRHAPDSVAPPAADRRARVDGPSIDELDAAIRSIASQINTATYELLVLVREFDDRFGWGKWSFRNGSEWLAWRSGISVSAAREQLRTAHALRRLPLTSAAFKDGRLSYSKVRALTRVVEPHNEDALLAYALDATAQQVEQRCRQMRNVLAESAEEAKMAWQRRSLTVWRNTARGTLNLTAELPVEVGELLLKALERALEIGDAASGPEFAGASYQTQQADALVALAQAYLSGGSGGGEVNRSSAADHYQVVVHVDAAALGAEGSCALARPGDSTNADPHEERASAEEPVVNNPTSDELGPDDAMVNQSASSDQASSDQASSDSVDSANAAAWRPYRPEYEKKPSADAPLRGGVPRSDLPIEVIKRLTCDGSLVVVAEDPAGQPLNVGRKQRTVSTAIRRALWSRDRGCIFPGCGKTRWVHAHHLIHWVNGGETSVRNTILLCSHHHRLVHEGGYRIRRGADGELYFERMDGRVIPRCGYRIDDARPDPVHLGEDTAESWLAALVRQRKPGDEVREERPSYPPRPPPTPRSLV